MTEPNPQVPTYSMSQLDQPTQPQAPSAAAPAAAQPEDGSPSFSMAQLDQNTDVPTMKYGVKINNTPLYEDTFDRWERKISETVGKYTPDAVMNAAQVIDKKVNKPTERSSQELKNIAEEKVGKFMGYMDADIKHEMGKVPTYAKGLEGNYLRSQVEEQDPTETGVVEGIAGIAGSIVGDPKNWPFMAKGIVKNAAAVPAVVLRPYFDKMMSRFFGAQMAHGANSQLDQLVADWPTLSKHQKAKGVTELIGGLYMAQGALREGFAGEPKVATAETIPPQKGGEGPLPKPAPNKVFTNKTDIAGHTIDTSPLQTGDAGVVAKAAKSMASPDAAKEFQENQRPELTGAAIDTLGQQMQDRIAGHDSLANGEESPETITGTQAQSKFENVDEMHQGMQESSERTYAKADVEDAKDIASWQREVKAAQQAYREMIDQHNELTREHNENPGNENNQWDYESYDEAKAQVPPRPKTYAELKSELDQTVREMDSPDNLVRAEAHKNFPKADKALDKWFTDHEDAIPPAEYRSAKRLRADAEKVKKIADAVRQPIIDGKLTSGNMSTAESAVNRRAVRAGRSENTFAELLGPEAYSNWKQVKELFRPIKAGTKSWGTLAVQFLATHLLGMGLGIPSMLEIGGDLAGVASERAVGQWLANKALFNPEAFRVLRDTANWMKDAAHTAVELPSTIKNQLVSLINKYKESSERGSVGVDINKPRFGRTGLGGAAAAPALAPMVNPEFQSVEHGEYADAVRSNPQAATLTNPDEMTNNRKFSNGEGVYYSLSPEGDLQGLVNNSDKRGAIKAATEHAISQGAKTLDAWDLFLPKQYEKHGFERTERAEYDVSKYGEPSQELKNAWKAQGWKEGDPYPAVQYMRRSPNTGDMLASLKKYGTTTDVLKAGFILPEGDMVPLQGEHDHMLGGKTTEDTRERFIKDTGAIRTRYRMTRAGEEQVFSLPDEVTESQVRKIRDAASKLKNGRIVLETVTGKNHEVIDNPTVSKITAALDKLVDVKESVDPEEAALKQMSSKPDDDWMGKARENLGPDASLSKVLMEAARLKTEAGATAKRPEELTSPMAATAAVAPAPYQPSPIEESVTNEGRPSDDRIAELHDSAIATRIPSDKDADLTNRPSHAHGLAAIDEAEALRPTRKLPNGNVKQGYAADVADKLMENPATGVKINAKERANPRKVIEKYVEHFKNNLVDLYHATPDIIKGPAKQWYESAHYLSKRIADTYDVSHEQVAGVIAALSPQNFWDNNVGLAERFVKHWSDAKEHKYDPAMDENLDRIRGQQVKMNAKKVAKGGEANSIFINILDAIRGKDYGDLEKIPGIETAALRRLQGTWLRLFDEAHGNETVPLYSPDGSIRDYTHRTHVTYDMIAKAIDMLENPKIQDLHEIIGHGQKIRNFYNNIINPWSNEGHVTIDTHAVGAAMGKPMASTDKAAVQNFSQTPKMGAMGLGGTYAVFEEAYARAAKQLGVAPRELQSITWEGIRSLITEQDKKSPEYRKDIDDIWKKVESGKMTRSAAMKAVMERAGGFKKPDWVDQADWDREMGPTPSSDPRPNGPLPTKYRDKDTEFNPSELQNQMATLGQHPESMSAEVNPPVLSDPEVTKWKGLPQPSVIKKNGRLNFSQLVDTANWVNANASPEEVLQTSAHEMAHAFLQHHLGVETDGMHISLGAKAMQRGKRVGGPDSGVASTTGVSSGHVNPGEGWKNKFAEAETPDQRKQFVEDMVTQLMAGRAVEEILQLPHHIIQGHIKADVQMAKGVLKTMGVPTYLHDTYLNVATKRALATLRANWDTVHHMTRQAVNHFGGEKIDSETFHKYRQGGTFEKK